MVRRPSTVSIRYSTPHSVQMVLSAERTFSQEKVSVLHSWYCGSKSGSAPVSTFLHCQLSAPWVPVEVDYSQVHQLVELAGVAEFRFVDRLLFPGKFIDQDRFREVVFGTFQHHGIGQMPSGGALHSGQGVEVVGLSQGLEGITHREIDGQGRLHHQGQGVFPHPFFFHHGTFDLPQGFFAVQGEEASVRLYKGYLGHLFGNISFLPALSPRGEEGSPTNIIIKKEISKAFSPSPARGIPATFHFFSTGWPQGKPKAEEILKGGVKLFPGFGGLMQ